ncbi:hypothetical protein [Bradyrhizobium sp. SZCCHNPS1003]|uniref:DUF7717 family protein n=1 Tax=Bradyrhizobium sp. SZCCHNPS1003 TaxID=3057330 RepID=UPI0028E8089A|nr:hypothetical protein [Bradyrhizobium sp. SZCCHNPS1003]
MRRPGGFVLPGHLPECKQIEDPMPETAKCTLCAAVESPGFYTGCMVRDGEVTDWRCDGKGHLTRATFREALDIFYQGCQRISEEHRAAKYSSIPKYTWHIVELNKRWKIIQGTGVHCFVDKATGDVLKAESWSKPAEHARGNIFDEHNGLEKMGPYGPAYLR